MVSTLGVGVRGILVGVALGLATGGAWAEGASYEFVCSRGEVVRTVGVDYLGEGRVPCRVKVDASGEGMRAFPWRTRDEAGFCEGKVDAMVRGLRGQGFECILRGEGVPEERGKGR